MVSITIMRNLRTELTSILYRDHLYWDGRRVTTAQFKRRAAQWFLQHLDYVPRSA